MIKRNTIFLIGILFLSAIPFVFGIDYFGETSETFVTGTSGWYCNSQGQWQNGTQIVTNNCSKYSAETGITSCCPKDTDRCDNGICGGYAKYCYQYNTSNSCTYASPTAVANSVNSNTPNITCGKSKYFNESCSDYADCRCKWVGNKCTDVVNITQWCGDGSITNLGECTWNPDTIVNNCNNSLDNVIVTKTVVWSVQGVVKPDFCQNVVKQYQCPPTAKLLFFSNLMMFVSVGIIIVVYVFRVSRRKK